MSRFTPTSPLRDRDRAGKTAASDEAVPGRTRSDVAPSPQPRVAADGFPGHGVAEVIELRPTGGAIGDRGHGEGLDAAIVASLRAGHPSAPAALFDRHAEHIERLLLRIIGRDGELEDVLHEVFAESLDKIDRLREPRALRPWLTRIAVHKARDLLRRRSRSRWLRFLPHDEVPEVSYEPTSHAEQVCAERVYALLAELPADDRIAFALREVDEMTLPEIAAVTGASLATVKRRIHRARCAMQAAALTDPWLRERFDFDSGTVPEEGLPS